MIVNFIGDTHLGRQFITNVPPHRRGDREQLIWDKFVAKLNEPCDVSIHVGDLFDKAVVPYSVITQTVDAYSKAASDHPETTFLVTRGNHDAGREEGVVTAYDLFQRLIQNVNNIFTTDDVPLDWGGLLIVPYHPTKSSEELLAPYLDKQFDLVVGHWDKRLLPLDALSKITTRVVSGHEHKPCTYGMVEFVGSIMPMAYGEDADGAEDPLYVDVGLEEVTDADR